MFNWKHLSKRPRYVLGWNEYVSLPDWGIKRVRAKVDTGARTSALHVEQIKRLSSGRISFWVVTRKSPRKRRIRVVTHYHRKASVRSSIGFHGTRYFVHTTMRIGPVERRIEINLVDRGRMLYRMLLGRTAVQGHFLVDVGHACLLSRSGGS